MSEPREHGTTTPARLRARARAGLRGIRCRAGSRGREGAGRSADRRAAGRDRGGEGAGGRAHVAARCGRHRASGRTVGGRRRQREAWTSSKPSSRTEQERLERLTVLLESRHGGCMRLQAEYRRAVAILEARVRAIYIEEQPDALSVLVSATTLQRPDRQLRVREPDRAPGSANRGAGRETAKRLAAEERRATERTQRLTAATVSVIAARTDEARSVRNELASSRDTLAAARRLKQSALATSRETREEYLQEVEALAAQSAIARCCDSGCSGGAARPEPARRPRQGSSGRSTGRCRAGSACAGVACTRASTSRPPPERRSGRPRPER